MSIKRVLTIAKLHGLDIVRRPLTLALLAVLPIVIYFALGDDPYAVVVGGVLMGFSIAGPAIFVLLTGRPIDQRLTLSGFRPAELVLGRVVLLNALGLGVAGIFSALVVTQSSPSKPSYVVIGTLLVALVAVPLGLALASVMPGDLEATLVMIGVVGVQVALRGVSPVGRFLPFYGARQLLLGSTGQPISVGTAIAHSFVAALIMFVLATYALHRRCRVYRPVAVTA